MKKYLIIIAIIFIRLSSYGQTDIDSSKLSFYKAYDALQYMLESKDSLNYEKAVFITENAYHNNYFDYGYFKKVLDFHTSVIKQIAENVRSDYKEKYKTLKPYEQKMFMLNTTNWAIFKYITDTAFFIINNETFYKKPYTYSYQDPYGSNNCENTQVMSLLMGDKKQGNCYSLAVLFKLFSDRLNSDARLTVTPHHIYIQNRNEKGDFCNVELASKSFPGDGSIQTLTYTTNTSVKNGMAQRMLSDKEAVALNLIYLAKGYQHKFKDNTGDFLLQCANLAFKNDSLSLNALLLKAEITENRLLSAIKANRIITTAKARLHPQTKDLLTNYEAQLNNLYVLGYREVPKDIERIILAAIQHREEGNILKDKTPNPFASIHTKQPYITLSNGLFDEMHVFVDTIQYAHVLFNTNTKKVIKFLSVDSIEDYKVDPVVFALSVDPMSDKYPNISPYAYCNWNPVMLVDPDGMQHYTVDENGNVSAVEGKGVKDKFDMLYKKAEYDKGKLGNGVKINNQKILSQLSKKDANGVSKAVTTNKGQDDMINAFIFLADNSNVEWRLDRYSENNKTNYSLGTIHDVEYSPSAEDMGHSQESTIAFIHSHPSSSTLMADEIKSMGYLKSELTTTYLGDSFFKKNDKTFKNSQYYTYFPNSYRLWRVEGKNEPSFIRNTKGNYKRLFFGTLNTK